MPARHARRMPIGLRMLAAGVAVAAGDRDALGWEDAAAEDGGGSQASVSNFFPKEKNAVLPRLASPRRMV
ncbi:hypothetical protein GPA_18510 [Gordonibacter pamelaeae 7-10-1-b]|uniref:Uncharacterized protein n=1 Tax=Gordonibacter pamelaeae 7-10-1-b TaxID=657308 RepID=D6E979_9ACTN|nr:hypothetical protein GPA_18510 [Gordonibacter pamelaeae 7-10-1-b]